MSRKWVGGLIAPNTVIAVVGPTGSGKSAFGISLASRLGGEIVNCDSVQVYRGFDVGSAKPSAADRQKVPHHLLDIIGGNEDYDAARFAKDAKLVCDDVLARGLLPILVGGTGLYLRALLGETFHDLPTDAALRAKLSAKETAELYAELRQLDGLRAASLHPNDRLRIVRSLEICLIAGRPFSELVSQVSNIAPSERSWGVTQIFLHPPRPDLHKRIAERTKAMLDGGLIKETRGLLASGLTAECKPMQSIGYAEACAFLRGDLSLEELPEKIIHATRQYAKRQLTWFRKQTPRLEIFGFGEEEASLATALRAIST